MKIKSTKKSALLNPIGWLVLLLIALIGFAWVSKNLDTNSFHSTKITSKNKDNSRAPQQTFKQVLEAHQDKTILLSVKDEASKNFMKNYRSFVKKMGGQELSALGYREAYVGIVENGKFIKEQRSKADILSTTYKNYGVISAPIPAGDYNLIFTSGDTIRRDKRGIHAFVIDENDVLTNTYIFDFFKSNDPRSADIPLSSVFEFLPQMTIELSERKFQKFQKKRAQALKDGILVTEKDDIVRAKLLYEQKKYPIDIRLKGDWTDHLIDNKWSFRVHTDTEDAIMGMQKFSLHHPRARNYAGEWLFHEVLSDQDIISLRYKFIQLYITIKSSTGNTTENLGVYAIEEFFAKQLIESNERRAGILLKIDEDLIWRNRVEFNKLKLSKDYVWLAGIVNYQDMAILPFSEKSIRKDSSLLDQFSKARTLLQYYIKDSLSFSEVFDVPLMAKYNAICNLLGANHALIPHNLRFYYNPISARLEPVGFDANGLQKQLYPSYFEYAQKDLSYMTAYSQAVEELIADDYFNKILNWPALDEQVSLMNTAFPVHNWDGENILKFNRQILRSIIDPTGSLHIFLNDFNENYVSLTIENYGRMPVVIESLADEFNRSFGFPDEEIVVLAKEQKTVRLTLNKNFHRLFINKKKKKAGFSLLKDIERVKVNYSVIGTKKIKQESILPWSSQSKDLVSNDIFRRSGNVAKYPYLEVDEKQKNITCKPGIWELPNTMIIPSGYRFKMGPGSSIHLTQSGSKIISFSPVQFVGTPDRPIRFFAKQGKGKGLLIMNSVDTSRLHYCEFDNLANPVDKNWGVSGAINFYDAPVKITHTKFTNNRSEDALNIIKTDFTMDEVVFSGTQSDAFDGDFVRGTIRNAFFDNLGNDAIDISGSTVELENIIINLAGDKGLSAGEKSTLTGKNIKVINSEIGVATKDDSTLKVTGLILEDNELGFTAFQKKPEFGPAILEALEVEMKNNTLDYLIENKSSLLLNGELMPTVDRVKDQMYGVIYGKSSKK